MLSRNKNKWIYDSDVVLSCEYFISCLKVVIMINCCTYLYFIGLFYHIKNGW